MLNKMRGQLQDAGNTTTLAHYLELLSGAGLVSGLQKHAGDALSRAPRAAGRAVGVCARPRDGRPVGSGRDRRGAIRHLRRCRADRCVAAGDRCGHRSVPSRGRALGGDLRRRLALLRDPPERRIEVPEVVGVAGDDAVLALAGAEHDGGVDDVGLVGRLQLRTAREARSALARSSNPGFFATASTMSSWASASMRALRASRTSASSRWATARSFRVRKPSDSAP